MREAVIHWLKDNVSPHRLEHILEVEKFSAKLARKHGVDPDKAAQAGLMHDLAKFFPPPRLLAIANEAGIEIDEVCRVNPHLLHADVSEVVAQREFGVKDGEILEAIRCHTLGSPGMGKLACLVFVADALEPKRGNSEELEKMRQTSKKDLYKSVQQTCDYSLKYLLNHQVTIHPRVILTRNWALQLLK
ncbi:MAG: bis(5'-nucleosyl)-tetraphosphatase (symmetrical) YqeK [Snowella sp.]|nr:bis(5'-nucleosyl)-tetraphosphatase (symmetrical) YqeK [Snowella sp.]